MKIDIYPTAEFCGRSFCRTYRIYFTMLVFDIKGVRLSCDFSFFAVLALFFFFDSGSGLCAFLACIFHELGHLAIMVMYNVRISSIYLYGGGIRLTSVLESCGWSVQLAVSAAGCAANLVLALISCLLGVYTVAAINILMAAVNMLPFGKLDGARIAELLCMKHAPSQRVGDVLKLVKLISAIAAILLLMLAGVQPDVTFIIFGIYLVFLDRI